MRIDKKYIFASLAITLSIFITIIILPLVIIAIGPAKDSSFICYPNYNYPEDINRTLQLRLITLSFLGLFKENKALVYNIGDETKAGSFIHKLPYSRARDMSHDMELVDPETQKVISRHVSQMDKFARRTTAQLSDNPQNSLLIFGDSWVYGDFLSEQQTLPSQIAKYLPDTEVLNYGIRGGGPNHALVSMAKLDPSTEKLQDKGVVLYIWENWHFWRTKPYVHNISFINCRTTSSVDYDFKMNLGLSQADIYPARTAFTLFLHTSKIKYLFDWHKFPKEDKFNFRDNCRYFLKMKQLVNRKLPNYKFLVVNYPTEKWGKHNLQSCLEELSINYLNLTVKNIPYLDPKYYFSDGHPTAYMHQFIAPLIANKLKDPLGY